MITELFLPTVAKGILEYFLTTAARIKEGVGVTGETNHLPFLSCLDFYRKKKIFSRLLLFCWRKSTLQPAYCTPTRRDRKAAEVSGCSTLWPPNTP